MLKVTAAEGKRRLGELLSKVAYAKERVLFTRRGQPVAVLIPVDDLERLRAEEGQKVTFTDLCGTLSRRTAKALKQAITEECERIDAEAW